MSTASDVPTLEEMSKFASFAAALAALKGTPDACPEQLLLRLNDELVRPLQQMLERLMGPDRDLNQSIEVKASRVAFVYPPGDWRILTHQARISPLCRVLHATLLELMRECKELCEMVRDDMRKQRAQLAPPQ